MSLEQAIPYVAGMARVISGIKAAPDYPPERVSAYPYILTYPSRGNLEWEPGPRFRGLHQITCDIRFARQSLPQAIKFMIPFIKLFTDKLASDSTLGGTVDTIVASDGQKIEYELVFSQAVLPEAVIRFKFFVKIRE